MVFNRFGVEWADGEIGIGADSLYRLGKEQTGVAFPVTEFNVWMERNGLSLPGHRVGPW
jgi:hypothetical protein